MQAPFAMPCVTLCCDLTCPCPNSEFCRVRTGLYRPLFSCFAGVAGVAVPAAESAGDAVDRPDAAGVALEAADSSLHELGDFTVDADADAAPPALTTSSLFNLVDECEDEEEVRGLTGPLAAAEAAGAAAAWSAAADAGTG